MTEKIDGRTKRALDMAIAKKQISRASYDAVLGGTLTLDEAKELGRSGTLTDTSGTDSSPASATGRASAGSPQDGPDIPPQPVSRIFKGDRSRECMCGCGERTAGGRFRMGHDMRMVSLAKVHLRGEAEPSEEQLAYLEESGKLERARQQLEKEERKRQEKNAAKTERKHEGEAEAKKRNAK